MRIGDDFNPAYSECGFYPQDNVDAIWGLSDGAKRVYSRLVRYASGGACYPSQATLSANLGKVERQIRKDLLALENAGLIGRLARAHRRSNTYVFLWHAAFDRNDSSSQTEHEETKADDLRGTPVPVKRQKPTHQFLSREELKGNLRGTDCDLRGTSVPPTSSSDIEDIQDESETRVRPSRNEGKKD